MGGRCRTFFWVVLCVVAWAAAGAAMNALHTAGSAGGERVLLTFGSALVAERSAGGDTWYLSPQLRLTIGLNDWTDLGFQTGVLNPIGTADVSWLGALVDVKLLLASVPNAYTLAWGLGGGYGLDLFGDGWGIFAQLLFESDSPVLPIFVAYRPTLPFDAAAIQLDTYIAAGIHLRLASIARLLLAVDFFHDVASLGLGLEISF
jgi:hypothetical protein